MFVTILLFFKFSLSMKEVEFSFSLFLLRLWIINLDVFELFYGNFFL